MKKLIIILLMLITVMSNAQVSFKANRIKFIDNEGVENTIKQEVNFIVADKVLSFADVKVQWIIKSIKENDSKTVKTINCNSDFGKYTVVMEKNDDYYNVVKIIHECDYMKVIYFNKTYHI